MGKKRKKKPRIMRPEFLIFQVTLGWRWVLQANNGKVYAKCGHNYTTRKGCLRAIEAIKNLASSCEVA